jgi:restriction endonuclease S subunit
MRPTDAMPHPDDWSVTTVGKAVEIRRGVSWSKDQEHPQPRDGAVPVIGISNVQQRLELDNLVYLSGVPEKARNVKRASKGWCIIVGSNGNRDRIGTAVFQAFDADFLFASFLIAAKPRSGAGIMPEFFYRWLTTEWVQQRITATSEGTTGLSNLAHDFFRAMRIAFPGEVEQAGITRILDEADSAIDRTRAALEKSRRLKRALLQAAFRGDFCSESRVQTELGPIPHTWRVLRGRQAFRTLGGYAPSVIRYARDGALVDAYLMKVEDFNDEANARQITRTSLGFVRHDNPHVETLPLGTVVIAKRGAAISKDRVRVTRVPVALDPNLMGLRLIADIEPEFFRYQLEWRRLSRYVETSGIPQLNNKDLYPRPFIVPPAHDQTTIISLLKSVEQLEDLSLLRLRSTERLRRGLLQQLVTGMVRAVHLPSGPEISAAVGNFAGARLAVVPANAEADP